MHANLSNVKLKCRYRSEWARGGNGGMVQKWDWHVKSTMQVCSEDWAIGAGVGNIVHGQHYLMGFSKLRNSCKKYAWNENKFHEIYETIMKFKEWISYRERNKINFVSGQVGDFAIMVNWKLLLMQFQYNDAKLKIIIFIQTNFSVSFPFDSNLFRIDGRER